MGDMKIDFSALERAGMENRVRMMASGDHKWDLSDMDLQCLQFVLAELRTLRARVAELTAGAVELTDGTKDYNNLIAERDRLRAELAAKDVEAKEYIDYRNAAVLSRNAMEKQRDAAQAEAAGLREAANKIKHWHDWGRNDEGMVVSSASVRELWAALASAPDQHRGRIVAAGFKQAGEMALAVKVNGTIDTAASIRDFIGDALIAHGERLEKEAAWIKS